MMKEFDHDFLKSRMIDQKCRDSLNGNTDPFSGKAKKYQKNARDHFRAGLTEVNACDFFRTEEIANTEYRDNHKHACGYPEEDDCSFLYSQDSSSFLTKKDKKKKDGKKAKKRKKKSKKMFASLEENLCEKAPRNANILSEAYKLKQNVIADNNVLCVYDEEGGCYYPRNSAEVAADIKAYLDEDTRLKINSKDYKEAYAQLMISKDIACEEGFFENRPYVNCLNGVVDIRKGVLLEHSPDFRFKHCIRAEYNPNAECPRFLEYADYITGGNKELKKLLRVIMGYIFSHYNNAKLAVLIYGIPHTGKSVLCNLISRIIGEDYVTNIDIAMLHRQEYAASLANAILNVAPDLKNEPLKDTGYLKSLLSKDDTVTARTLYANPTKIRCETKMLFSSNHLISFSPEVGTYDIEAVFNRLLFFPFQNTPIKDSENNKHLSDELFEERSGIFTWAMEGLKYYVEHNENFPDCALSAEIKARNVAQFCPEKIFFSEAIEYAEGRFESSSAIKMAFENFCMDIGAKVKGNIHAYLEEHEHLPKSKKRIDGKGYLCSNGNPIYVYEGIRLKKDYRSAE